MTSQWVPEKELDICFSVSVNLACLPSARQHGWKLVSLLWPWICTGLTLGQMDAAEGRDWSAGELGIVLFLPMFGKMLWPLKPSTPIILISRSSKTPSQHTSWKNETLYGGCFGAAVQVFYTTVIFPVIKTLTYFQLAGKQPNLQALEVHYHIPGCTRQRKPWLKLMWSWPGSHVPTSLCPSFSTSLLLKFPGLLPVYLVPGGFLS